MAGNKSDVTSPLMEFRDEASVFSGNCRDLAEHRRWEKGIVVGAQQKRRSADGVKKANGAGPTIVVERVGESVHGRRDRIIEREQRPGSFEGGGVEKLRIARELGARLCAQRPKKVSRVDPRKSALDEARASFEIEGDGDCGRSLHFGGKIVSSLAEPLEQHVATQ